MSSKNNKTGWTKEIKPKVGLLEIDFSEIWRFRDLIRMFVFRNFVTQFKQTILGPIWFFIQPLFFAYINYFIFGKLSNLGPEGVPGILFYMSGPIVWQYFQDCFTVASNTFIANQNIFGKVYFPRIIMPLSSISSNLLKLGVQLLLLIGIGIYFSIHDERIYIQKEVIFFPFLLMILILLSMGFGLFVTSMTSKYRDLQFLVNFAVPMLKYITPGIATSMLIFKKNIPENLQWAIDYNPIGYILDSFNFMFTSAGDINLFGILYALITSVIIFILGLIVFNQTEKTFMDTV